MSKNWTFQKIIRLVLNFTYEFEVCSTSLYLFQTVAVSDENRSFWDRSWEYLFVQNFFEL